MNNASGVFLLLAPMEKRDMEQDYAARRGAAESLMEGRLQLGAKISGEKGCSRSDVRKWRKTGCSLNTHLLGGD